MGNNLDMRQSLSFRLGILGVCGVSIAGFYGASASAFVLNQLKLDKNFAVLKAGAGEAPALGSVLEIQKNGQACTLKVYSVKGPWVAATPESCGDFSNLKPGDSFTPSGGEPIADAPTDSPATVPSAPIDPAATNDPQYEGQTESQANTENNPAADPAPPPPPAAYDPQYSDGPPPSAANKRGSNTSRSGAGKKGKRGNAPAETVDHHIGALLYYSLAGDPQFKYSATTTLNGVTASSGDVEGNYIAGGAPGIGLRYMYLPMNESSDDTGDFHVGFNVAYSYDLKRKVSGITLKSSNLTTSYTDLNFQISNLELNLIGETSGLVFFLGPNYSAINVTGKDKDEDINYLASFGMQAGVGYLGSGLGIELLYRSLNGKLGSAVEETEITTDRLRLAGFLLRGTAYFSF